MKMAGGPDLPKGHQKYDVNVIPLSNLSGNNELFKSVCEVVLNKR